MSPLENDMVALELQRDLADEIARITREMRFSAPDGKVVGLNVFEQNLPVTRKTGQAGVTAGDYGQDEKNGTFCDYEQDEENTEDTEHSAYFPYCLVKLDSGESDSPESAHIIRTLIRVGIFDDSTEAHGYKNILNIFEDIRVRFRKNPVLNDRYIAGDEMAWGLSDDDERTYPYFFGVMYLDWQAPEIRREDSYL